MEGRTAGLLRHLMAMSSSATHTLLRHDEKKQLCRPTNLCSRVSATIRLHPHALRQDVRQGLELRGGAEVRRQAGARP